MIVKLEELENPTRVKVVPWCNECMIYLNGNNYRKAMRLIKTIAENYSVAYNNAVSRQGINIFCEKENRKEVMIEVKQWVF